ncbi:MAG: DUF3048 domain-containing protein [Bacillota bacterium]|nr:DUF3048 domain-containing protein [Bacillota bacterium]
MKKIICIILTLIFILSGCAKQTVKVSDNQPDKPADNAAQNLNPEEFYTKMTESNTRPIALMIDNDKDYTGPQAGLENAYLIYEMYVEGGSTRLMALFKDAKNGTDVDTTESRIGPIRSSRHYFLDFALENDAIYGHCGWSPKAQADIKSLGVNNVNGLTEGGVFKRFSKYNNTWHNLYTTYELILNSAKSSSHSYRTTTNVSLNYSPNFVIPKEGYTASKISIPYSAYNVSYQYDEEKNLYMRYKKDSPHTMQSGVQLSCTNLLILKMQNENLKDTEKKGRQELYDTGSGKGYYITGGNAKEITWSKESRTAQTVYTYESGSKVSLNPGVTYIQIVPPSMNISIE